MDTLSNNKESVEYKGHISVGAGICECCPNDGPLFKFIDIKMCAPCLDRELECQKDLKDPAKQAERLQAHRNLENVHLEHIRQENARLKVSTDIFNAKIKSIADLKKEIDSSEIENKNFTLAKVLNERYVHLNNLLHEHHGKIAEYENEQRAIQTFYNDFSKQLREEERKKLQLADLTYKPLPVVQKVKKETPKKKYDKTGIAAASMISGIPEQLIQMVCVARDITPEAAVMILKEQGLGKK